MTLLIFQYPLLCLAALGCGGLCAVGARQGNGWWFWGCCMALTALVVAALTCMIPYVEIILLLLPSVYSTFITGRKEGAP
ncbi:MAG: hypothetical protein PUC00_10120 [Clostridiales bacterium]|nr:hypothetical protein [Clostridiales bacterium]